MKLCSVEGCDRPSHASGLCSGHWERRKRGKPLAGPIRPYRRGLKPPCYATGCYRQPHRRGLCPQHYRRKHELRRIDWDRPLGIRRPKGQTLNIYARLSKQAGEALTRQARSRGYTLAEWARLILEGHVARALAAAAVRAELERAG